VWQTDELLRRLAGANGPKLDPGDDEASRKKYREAWHAWWRENGAKMDLTQVNATPTRIAKVNPRASNSWNEQHTPDKAFDGGVSWWNSGNYAPQWLEADLRASTQLSSIQLVVAQLPAGLTTHEVWVSNEPIGENRARAKLAHTFNGNTDNGQQLKFEFPKEVFARYMQIRTTQSPSWVGWTKVELRVGRPRFAFVRD
jgi:hypothetical protein